MVNCATFKEKSKIHPLVSTRGNLKTKKTNNMPLAPKQQAPYYNPTTFPKIYRAKLTQLGTANPTVVENINTIGDITWERSMTGIYITPVLSGAFPLHKTFMTIQNQQHNNPFGITFSADQAIIYTGNPLSDDMLDNTSVTITIYQ